MRTSGPKDSTLVSYNIITYVRLRAQKDKQAISGEIQTCNFYKRSKHMRKVTVWIGLILLLIAGPAVAQQAGVGEFQRTTNFGVRLGLNRSTLGGENDGLSSRTSFHVGALINYRFSRTLAFQPELQYSGQGARIEAFGEEVEYNFDYINLPLMVVLYPGGESVYFEAGPQFSLKVRADRVQDGETREVTEIKDTDFGLAFGVGVNVKQFFFNLRLNGGLLDIVEDDLNIDWTNRVLQLSVGVKL